MTDQTSLVNLALQSFGSRTTLTAAQLAAGSNNEAKQANLSFEIRRNSLLRMAPWNCALHTRNLTYITSVTGTPENTSPAAPLWGPGIPRPPWSYEYQYPVDCLRPCWIISASQTGGLGTPITNAVTGYSPSSSYMGPIVYKVGIDTFFPVIGATVVNGGTNYAVGDSITLASGPSGSAPIGAPVSLSVLTVTAGAVATVAVIAHIIDSNPIAGGSYFTQQPNPVGQGSTTGLGTGATFNLTYGPKSDQRVILTNQSNATLVYARQVIDPNIWDPLFQEAFIASLGAGLCISLTGDKSLANICVGHANRAIEEARKGDGNEGLTINDVVPDWIRERGVNWGGGAMAGPGFDWGGLLPSY